MAYKLQTELGKAVYGLRKSTVEPVIGIIKEVLGFRQFSLGWCLVCLAWNLKRLLQIGCNLTNLIENYFVSSSDRFGAK